jgi:hypothetical protein
MRRSLVTVLAFLGLMVPAHAADVICGTAPAGWNLPKGAVSLTIGDGPVRATLQGVGESRTHSMISQGNGWVTHASMKQPTERTSCSQPLVVSTLRDGFPGASQVNMGAAYVYIQGATQYYQRGVPGGVDKGAAIADYIWNSMPYEYDSRGFYRLKNNSGNKMNYVLYQYRDAQGSGAGQDAWNNGIVCSTLLGYAQAKAGFGAVSNYTYSHTKIVGAINGLYSAVENECSGGLGFWKGLGAGIVCIFTDFDFNGPCNDVATQVTDCMATGKCDDGNDDGNYKGVRDNASTVATAISPDRIGGWNGHPTTASVWAYDINNATQWNSGGSVYGCWD